LYLGLIDEISHLRKTNVCWRYDNVRRQVEMDMCSGGRYRLAGDGVKQYAEKLREEMERRLSFTPIDWPR
jgi:hypothetical protein